MKTIELLDSLKKSTKILSETVEANFASLSDENLNWKQDTSKWSILECIEHLNRYNKYYLKAIEAALSTAEPARHQSVASTWIGKKSIAMMNPANVKKQKTFKKMNPVNSVLSRKTLTAFLAEQTQLLILIDLAAKVNVNKARVPVEFFKLLEMTTAESLQFVVVHEQRHILQAKKVFEIIQGTKRPILAI